MSRQNRSVPNQPKTPLRAVRIPDTLWRAAKAVAQDRGDNLSEVIRQALADYVRRNDKGQHFDV